VGVQLHAGDSLEARAAALPAEGIHPPDDLLHSFALSLTDRVAGMPGGASVQPRGAVALLGRCRRRLRFYCSDLVACTGSGALRFKGITGSQAASEGRTIPGCTMSLPASASARVAADGFKLSTIELGIRIVAPLSLVVS